MKECKSAYPNVLSTHMNAKGGCGDICNNPDNNPDKKNNLGNNNKDQRDTKDNADSRGQVKGQDTDVETKKIDRVRGFKRYVHVCFVKATSARREHLERSARVESRRM
jgi:hypothetical protein